MSKRKFEKFYQKHLDKVYRYVFFRVGRDRELAEDLVSEVFIKALKNFEKYDKSISTSSWIMTITKNHLANHWRDSKKTVSLDEMVEVEQEDSNRQDRTFLSKAVSIFKRQIDEKHLYDILDKLEEENRELVTLHYICGYKYNEIAEMLEITSANARVKTHRAIKKLRYVYKKAK